MSHIPERSVARPRISIVVPALNEARNLEVVLPELPPVYEVIVVDGASTDGTVETALRVLPTVKIVKQTRRGKGNALVCGFKAASGDVVVMFDADGSADPAEIHRFVEALCDGADFAKGSRALEAGGSEDITVLRSCGNRAMTSITNLLFRTGYTDLCYGYNAFWRDVLGLLDLPSPTVGTPVWGDGFEIETVLNCRVAAAGLTVREVASVERPRMYGASNLHAARDGLRVLKTIITERWVCRSLGRRRAPAAPRRIGAVYTSSVEVPVASAATPTPWTGVSDVPAGMALRSRPGARVAVSVFLPDGAATPLMPAS